MNHRLLKPAEAADYLGLSKMHLARLRCEGRGPLFVRLGGAGSAVRYRLRDLEKWLDDRTAKSTSDVRLKGEQQ